MFQPDELNATTVADYIVKALIDNGSKVLYNTYLNNKVPLYTSEDILLWNHGVIQQQCIILDKGETKYSILNKWNDEDEPKSGPVDNIAKYAVKFKKPKNNSQNTLEDMDDSKSVRSSSSRVSRVSFQKTVHKLSTINRLLSASSKLSLMPSAENPKMTRSQSKVDTVEEEYQVVEVPDTKPPPEPDYVLDRLREEREQQQKDRFREAERMRKIKEEQQQFEEKKKEQQRQLRHKLYTWDFNGEIVFLKQGRQAEVTLQVQEILSVDSKLTAGLQVVKENTTVPDVKPVKEIGIGGLDGQKGFEKAVAQEFPKQPPILETLHPKSGINIIFENGYMKEGAKLNRENKMSKDQYQQIIVNQPRPVPQYKIGNDEVIEKNDSLQEKLEENMRQQQQQQKEAIVKKIQIENEEQYFRMMQQESVRNSSSDSKGSKKTKNQSHIGKKLSAIKLPSKVRLERINAYKKSDLFAQSDSPKQGEQMKTKFHRVVERFDQNILENPQWGAVLDQYKEKRPTATAYKLKRSDQGKLFPNKSKEMISFPPIIQKVRAK